jgi:4-hydroxybenzoate polyprenyltransferase
MVWFSTVIGVFSTSRPATSLLFASTGSAFLYLAHKNIRDILGIFLIVLLLSFMTFTVNDLIDAERDRVNHPKRFLVISPSARAVAVVYYLLLIACYCVVAVDFFAGENSWVFLLLLLIFINYSIVKISAPLIKNVYIAAANIGLSWSIIAKLDIEANFWVGLGALLFMTSREILMDIPDIDGDRDSIAKRLGLRKTWLLVTASSFVAALALAPSLLPHRIPMFALAFALPIFFLVRSYRVSHLSKVDPLTETVSGLPYIHCCYLIISS